MFFNINLIKSETLFPILFFLKKDLFFNCVYICVCVSGGCWNIHMRAGATESRRSLDTIELGLQVFVISLTWILRPELNPLLSIICSSLPSHLFRLLSVFPCITLQPSFLFTFYDCRILHYFTHPRGRPLWNTEMVMQEMIPDLDPERRMGLWCAWPFT